MAFLSWLMSQGHGLNQIAPAMVALGDSGTLAHLYANLTSDAAGKAWPAFEAAVKALPKGVTSDDPFGGAGKPAQQAHLSLWTVALAAKVFDSILADIAAGEEAQHIVAGVRSLLAASSTARVPHAPVALCTPGSHRLLPPRTQ